LGTSILDAFAAKVPVVATEAGGIPEMVLHEETGMLAKPKDSRTLALYIDRLIESPECRKKIVENAYKKVLTFSKESTAEKTLSVYEEIVFS
jgi:glycosyltransferase involved in cell wall biosynthesis